MVSKLATLNKHLENPQSSEQFKSNNFFTQSTWFIVVKYET